MSAQPTDREPCALPSEASTTSFWHSEVSPLLKAHRTTRNLPSKADVVIIGSGITGASVAHHILNDSENATNGAASGPSVVMLEAREACWGATGRNGGHCQPLLFEHPEDPSIGHFELKNYFALQSLIDAQDIDCEFVAQPGVRAIYSVDILKRTERSLAAVQATAPELARYIRLVTAKDELAKYRVPTAVGAVVTAVAARMWPYKFVAHILEQLLLSPNLHGRFNLQTLTAAESIERNADWHWRIKTPRGIIDAERVVLATNAYTSHLLGAFTNLIVPCRGQMSALLPSPSISNANRLKTSIGFEGDGLDDYLIQRPSETDGQLMFGGGRQCGPSLGISDDSTVDEKTAAYLRTRLTEVLDLRDVGHTDKSGQLQATHQWTGIMGFSRDDLPWVGRVPYCSGMYIAAGFTGHGMPNAWLSGKAVALIVKHDIAKAGYNEAVEAAQHATGLPSAYLASMDRMRKAMELDDVEVRERQAIERCASDAGGDQPSSAHS